MLRFIFFKRNKRLIRKHGADLAAVILTVGAQTVTAAKVGVPRAATIELGRRPSVGSGCEFCPISIG